MIVDSCHGRPVFDPKLHLAITSDRVVTKTSNLDTYGEKTWGIYYYGPLHSSRPLFPRSFNSGIIGSWHNGEVVYTVNSLYPLPLSSFVKIIIKLHLPGKSLLIFNY